MKRNNMTKSIFKQLSGAVALYSIRQLNPKINYAMKVRRSTDNAEIDIPFNKIGKVCGSCLRKFANTGLPLDMVSGSYVAYGLRKLRSAYAGKAIRVRRSSDDAEADIGFDGNGELDEKALLAHVGTSSGYVKTFYNQSSGSAYDLTQATTTAQPRIVNAGVIDKFNGKVALYFDGTAMYMDTATFGSSPYVVQPNSYIIVSKMIDDGQSTNRKLYDCNTSGYNSRNMCDMISSTGMKYRFYSGSLVTTSIAANYNQNIVSTIHNGASTKLHLNGALQTTESTGTQAMSGLRLGGTTMAGGIAPNGGFTYGWVQEFIMFNGVAITDANRQLVEISQSYYYGVPITETNNTNCAYVKTWYDQSGNGNHATQTTVGSQPRIVNNGVVDEAILFDNVDDFFDIANSTSLAVTSAPLYISSVIKPTVADSGYTFCRNFDSAATVQYATIFRPNGNNNFYTIFNGTGYAETAAETVPQNATTVCSSYWDGVNVYNTTDKNTTASAAISGPLVDRAVTTIGARGNVGATRSVFYNGYIYEIIVYANNFSMIARNNLQNDQLLYYKG